jgi:hypothetical protein
VDAGEDAEAVIYPNADAEAQVERDTDAAATKLEEKAGVDTGAKNEAEAVIEPEADAETETQFEAVADAEVQGGEEADADAEMAAEVDAEADVETNAELEADSKEKVGTGAGTEGEGEADPAAVRLLTDLKVAEEANKFPENLEAKGFVGRKEEGVSSDYGESLVIFTGQVESMVDSIFFKERPHSTFPSPDINDEVILVGDELEALQGQNVVEPIVEGRDDLTSVASTGPQIETFPSFPENDVPNGIVSTDEKGDEVSFLSDDSL